MSDSGAFTIAAITFAGLGWWGCFCVALILSVICGVAELNK